MYSGHKLNKWVTYKTSVSKGSGSKVTIKNTENASVVNDSFPPNYKPPYKPGTKVNVIELEGGAQVGEYVRVYDNINSTQKGGWIMKAEDVVGLTPAEIQSKFALPSMPTHITDVVFDSTVTIRTGTANSLFGFDGGGTQFDLMGQRIGEFINARPLK